MWRLVRILGVVVLLAGTRAVADITPIPVPPPPSWKMLQNVPDPFCAAQQGTTRIEFEAPQSAHVELVVTSPDGSTVLRTLVDQQLAAGLFAVLWDGKDSNGEALAAGIYPYRFTARDASNNVLFQDTKNATLSCDVSTQPGTWSGVKSLYQ
jgi:hypothetical protein